MVQKLWHKMQIFPFSDLANSQKIATDKCLFYDHFWQFFANYMFNFQKTEVQMVILRSLMNLNLKWYKSYDIKCKKTQKRKQRKWVVFLQNRKKREREMFVFCVITFEPIKLNTSKWPSEPQFCERYKGAFTNYVCI